MAYTSFMPRGCTTWAWTLHLLFTKKCQEFQASQKYIRIFSHPKKLFRFCTLTPNAFIWQLKPVQFCDSPPPPEKNPQNLHPPPNKKILLKILKLKFWTPKMVRTYVCIKNINHPLTPVPSCALRGILICIIGILTHVDPFFYSWYLIVSIVYIFYVLLCLH